MLDQLVESKNHLSETRRRGGFLLTAFTIVFSISIFGLLYSLFSYNLAMAHEKLDISSLVSPVAPPETAPPAPEQTSAPKVRNTEKPTDKLPVRLENIQSTKESPVASPTGVSTMKNNSLSRPQSPFKIGPIESGDTFSNNQTGRAGNNEGSPIGIKASTDSAKVIETAPPPLVKKPEIKPAPTPVTIRRTEILNGEAIKLVKPTYPALARHVRAAGPVNVQVTIDENGNVASANAVTGHPLLREVSEQAARASKFTPTVLNGQKVKVTGIIVYNFVVL